MNLGMNLGLGISNRNRIPGREFLAALFTKNSDGTMTDSIGLSVNDFDTVDPTLQSLFFGPGPTLLDAATIAANIESSPLLNSSDLNGNSAKGYSLHATGTSADVLTKTRAYWNVRPGTFYHGVDIYGEYRTFTGLPAADFYVDSVNGLDTNTGTLDAPFQSIAKLSEQALADGIKIGLAAGSSWRECLSLIAYSNTTVQGYGSGKRPVLDGSDVVGSAAFAKTVGYTNIYQASSGGSGSSSTTFFSVWEDGVCLKYVSSLAACDATPGSFYIGSGDYPKTFYTHASDSSDITIPAKLYEVNTRPRGLGVGSSPAVKFIRTRRNLHADGSLVAYGDDVNIFGCLAEDGNKHNVYFQTGTVAETVAWKARTDGRTAATLFVNFRSNATGKAARYLKCLAIGTSYDRSVLDTIDGFYWHSVNTVDIYETIELDTCSASKVSTPVTGNVSATGTILYKNFKTKSSRRGITVGTGGTMTIDGAYLDMSDTLSSAPYSAVVTPQAGYSITIRNSTLLIKDGTSAIYGFGCHVDLQNSVLYRKSGGAGWADLIYRGYGSPTFTVKNTIFSSLIDTRIITDYGTVDSIVDNEDNVFHPSTAPYRIAGVPYANFAAYKTGYADPRNIDQNSITDDPLFTDAANGDFSLQAGSPAIAIGAGLSNPDVEHLEILSDEILALW